MAALGGGLFFDGRGTPVRPKLPNLSTLSPAAGSSGVYHGGSAGGNPLLQTPTYKLRTLNPHIHIPNPKP